MDWHSLDSNKRRVEEVLKRDQDLAISSPPEVVSLEARVKMPLKAKAVATFAESPGLSIPTRGIARGLRARVKVSPTPSAACVAKICGIPQLILREGIARKRQ